MDQRKEKEWHGSGVVYLETLDRQAACFLQGAEVQRVCVLQKTWVESERVLALLRVLAEETDHQRRRRRSSVSEGDAQGDGRLAETAVPGSPPPLPRQRIKSLVLDSVTSPHFKRAYGQALDAFERWCAATGVAAFTKTTVQAWRGRRAYGRALQHQDNRALRPARR
jgi:hypothetical protein